MDLLILIPGLLSGIAVLMRGAESAFLAVYLPTLLLLPVYYRLQVPGIKLTFAEAALLPIALAVLPRLTRLRLTVVDVLLCMSFLWIAFCELMTSGGDAVRFLVFDYSLSSVGPYIVARLLIEPGNLRVPAARRIVQLVGIVAVFSLWEFRLGTNPIRTVLNGMFPSQAAGWVTQLRWGFARVSGPYGHAILAGIIFSVAWLLNGWLLCERKWASRPLFGIPHAKEACITAILAAGVFMPMSRGPWLGLGAGITVFLIGRLRNVNLGLQIGGAVLFVGLLASGAYLMKYGSVGRNAAQTSEQETAAYRAELFELYIPVVQERFWTGWGMGFPQAPGAGSIDNHYLLLALVRGVPGLVLFCTLAVTILVRLLRGALDSRLPSAERSWRFTMAAAHVCILVTLTTVFMGEQIGTVFCILLGWSEATLTSPLRTAHRQGEPEATQTRGPLSFAKVIA